MRTWINAVGVAVLVTGAAQAQTQMTEQVTENDARSYVASAFITGAAPAILSENVRVSPELRRRLSLPEKATREAVYDALFALTEDKTLTVRSAPKQIPPADAIRAGEPVLEVDAPGVRLVVQYDLRANDVDYVGLPDSGAVGGASGPEPEALKALALAPVRFGFGDASLSDGAAAALDAALAGKLEHVSAVRITGHADPLGHAEYNARLSEERAEAVREHLAALGVDPSLVQVGAAGPAQDDACAGLKTLTERIACFAPQRRADISLQLR